MSACNLHYSEITDPDWLAFLTNRPGANIFHHPAWSQMLAKAYNLRPFTILMRDEHGHIQAGLPVMEINRFPRPARWVSLPFSDHCEPMLSTTEARQPFFSLLNSSIKPEKKTELEIRWDFAQPDSTTPPADYVLSTLELDPHPDKVFKGFHHSHQRNIIQAKNHALRVRRGTDLADVDAFYRLHLQTRRRQGVPIQPYTYFKLLWENLIAPGLGFVSLVYSGVKCIAGAIFLYWNDVFTYKYGASTSDTLFMRPNHLLFWDAIEWASSNGFTSFDMGRSDLSNTGLRTYKLRWGAVENPLSYSNIPPRSPHPATSGIAMQVIQAVIRRSPAQFCQLAGEIYYRHLA